MPLILWRAGRQKALEDKVTSQALDIARLQAETATTRSAWDALHGDFRGMRVDMQNMVASLGRLEGALTSRQNQT